MKYDKKFALKLIYIIPLFIALLVGMFNIYLSITGFEADKILTEEYATQYLYGDDLENQIEVAMMIQDGTMEIDARRVDSRHSTLRQAVSHHSRAA